MTEHKFCGRFDVLASRATRVECCANLRPGDIAECRTAVATVPVHGREQLRTIVLHSFSPLKTTVENLSQRQSTHAIVKSHRPGKVTDRWIQVVGEAM